MFNFIDKNQHVHEITVTFYDDSTSNACWFSYLFKADNFDEQVLCVQSFAEFLMIQLCDNGIDANLCKFNWGLEFKSSIDSVVQHMDLLITAIITSIKPMEWFYSKEPIRRFYHIHCHLMQILPHIKQEAEKGRWKGVEPNNFIILHDNTQAYIVLTYQEAGIYDMSFKIGLSENGFDEDVSGEWFTCEYKFDIRTSDKELSDYYLAE